MDFGKLLGDSFAYTKDGLFAKPATWIILIILTLLPVIPFFVGVAIFVPSLITGATPDIPTMVAVFVLAFIAAILLGAFYQGYQVRVLGGETPLPTVSGYGKLFSDGIGYIAIQIVYSIPVIIIIGITIGSVIMSAISKGLFVAEPSFEELVPILGGLFAGILIALIVGFIIGLFAIIGIVRFAKTGRIGEAFHFHGIVDTIRRIGWGSYILALIIVVVIVVIVEIVVGIIPYIGGIIQIIISPFIVVFYSRYIALLYNSAGEPAVPE
jgi:hypothetical protein